MSIKTSAGSTLRLFNGQPANYNIAGYSALAWVEVKEITEFPQFGKVFSEIEHSPVGSRAVQKRKGSFNLGKFELKYAIDNVDAGQIQLETLQDSDVDVSFEFTTNNGSKYYFQAQVGGVQYMPGNVNSILSASCPLNITAGGLNPGVVKNLVAT